MWSMQGLALSVQGFTTCHAMHVALMRDLYALPMLPMSLQSVLEFHNVPYSADMKMKVRMGAWMVWRTHKNVGCDSVSLYIWMGEWTVRQRFRVVVSSLWSVIVKGNQHPPV